VPAGPEDSSPPAWALPFVAWQQGDGALANVALDRALADSRRYSMAKLLRGRLTPARRRPWRGCR
jgi:hypothetical protein